MVTNCIKYYLLRWSCNFVVIAKQRTIQIKFLVYQCTWYTKLKIEEFVAKIFLIFRLIETYNI